MVLGNPSPHNLSTVRSTKCLVEVFSRPLSRLFSPLACSLHRWCRSYELRRPENISFAHALRSYRSRPDCTVTYMSERKFLSPWYLTDALLNSYSIDGELVIVMYDQLDAEPQQAAATVVELFLLLPRRSPSGREQSSRREDANVPRRSKPIDGTIV